MGLSNLLRNLPEVKGPVEKKLSFNVKLKWTLIILVAFFVLANIPIYGLAKNALDRFQYLAIIFGTDFGSIISLGISPIVMASLILQLLVGAGILSIDVKTDEGKRYYQGLQKMTVLLFIVFESLVYVLMRGLEAMPGYTGIVVFQLLLGGLAIFFMDEVVQKWGFGSGVSMFIAAGVGWRLFAGLFQFISPEGGNCLIDFSGTACAGKVLVMLQSIIGNAPKEAMLAFATILVTAFIFLMVVWAQSLKIEVPLSFDRLRGYGIKWPLAFFYASNIPVILTAALASNMQLFAGLNYGVVENCVNSVMSNNGIMQNITAMNQTLTPALAIGYCGTGAKIAYAFKWLGVFSTASAGSQPVSGLVFWVSSNLNILNLVLGGGWRNVFLLQSLTHILFYMGISTLFAVFWVKTSGMDASSQARNIISSGLQIPGFRKDERVLEVVLSRYIMPLTIMGGAAVGLLAATADLLGALTSGTAILLGVMIMYQFYNNIAQQHAMDMHPALKSMMG